MLKRNIFALTRTDPSKLLPDEALKHGWKLSHASELVTARKLVSDPSLFVGIVDFSTFKPDVAFDWQEDLAELNRTMLWLALVPAHLLNDQKFRENLAGRFFDYHTVPHDPERLLIILGHSYGMAMLNPGKADQHSKFNHDGMIGESASMRSVYRDVRKAAGVDYPVLVCGESGTGKELLAQAIHSSSSRAAGPFIAVNSAALPGNLIQSELFGHEKGAFTGAAEGKIGRIESANGGSLFLDEIGDLSMELQVILLRFIQEQVIHRVGGTQEIPVDVRIIAATHVDLEAAVEAGTFREDLYYRLNVLRLTPPPLRDRGNDIILLANYFLEVYRGNSKHIAGFTSQALETIAAHSWPGNVRELLNRIRRAVVMSESRLISPVDLGFDSPQIRRHRILSLDEARAAAERHAIQTALWYSGNNVSVAAKALDVSRMTLYRLMEKVGVSPDKQQSGVTSVSEVDLGEGELNQQSLIDLIPPLQAN